MKIKSKYFLLAWMLSLVLWSCKKDRNLDETQDKIYTDYTLFYDQNENKTHAVARFRFGGETGNIISLKDSTESSITFNGQKMPYNIWYGGHHKVYVGHIKEGVFIYENSNGISYSNAVPKGDKIQFQSDFDTLKKGTAQSIIWEGTSLLEGEKVGVFVGSWTWGEKHAFSCTGLGLTELSLTTLNMSDLAIGKVRFYLDRSIEKDVTEGTSVGGVISYKYRALHQFVDIIE